MRTVVNTKERAEIEGRAQAASLTVSGYLRAAALGKPVRSTIDREALTELAKVNADQGRLGGLLKLWLVDQPGRGAPAQNVRELLGQIEAMQEKLASIDLGRAFR